jgi:hypothetical protein
MKQYFVFALTYRVRGITWFHIQGFFFINGNPFFQVQVQVQVWKAVQVPLSLPLLNMMEPLDLLDRITALTAEIRVLRLCLLGCSINVDKGL